MVAIDAPRRSSRHRREVKSVYDDAKQEMKRLSESPKKKRRRTSASPSRRSKRKSEVDTNDDDDDNDEDHDDDEESSSSSISDEEEEFVKKKKKSAPKTPTKRTTSSTPKRSTTTKRNASRRKKSPKLLLRQLATKVLEPEEKPDKTLMAKLLQHAIASTTKPSNNDDATFFDFESFIRDSILPRDDAYEVQADLIHLLFRAVGGVHSPPYLDASKLEDYNHEDWDKVTNQLVDDMRYTPVPFFLLSNYDWEQQHVQSMVDMHQAFRQAWEAFWYQLVGVTLSSNDRFAMETVKDWNLRLHELLEVSQPDIRAAAVMASLQMALSLLKLTCDTRTKLVRYERQVKSCSSSQTKKKQLLLEEQVQPTKRWLEELEALVDTNLTAVFMNRYRDSNPVIRAYNLSILSQMMVLRPDLYLRDKYLKYIGWTLSDKNAQVRCAALDGLLATPYSDMDALHNVVRKFLPRLADCTIDVSHKVQEKAMALFLKLAKASLLEDFDDDLLWEQINNRALSADTTPVVRRDALYFIMDQLEAFDDDQEEEEEQQQQQKKKNSTWKRDKKASLVKTKEIGIAKKLNALASWVGHSLTNGPIPLEHLRLELADYVVESLRSMGTEYSSLVTNQWSAFVRAMKDSDYSAVASNDSEEQRVQVATQRVLIRMLSCAARAEFQDSSKSSSKSSDSFVNTLLPLMTNLLRQFQTDSHCLTNLASLCQYFISSSDNSISVHHPKLKAPMRDMIATLVDIYGTIGDERSLPVMIESLAVLMESCQKNASTTILATCKTQVEKLTQSLTQRLLELLFETNKKDDDDEPKKKKRKKRRSSTTTSDEEDNDDKSSNEDDKEFAIHRCSQRLSILAKRINIQEYLPENFRTTLIEAMTKRLEERQLDQSSDKTDDGDDPMENIIPLIWQQDHDSKVHEACSRSVKYTLDFLLVSLAWDLYLAKKEDDPSAYDKDSEKDDDDNENDDDLLEEYVNHPVVQQRDDLCEFLGTCFQQFLPEQQEYDDDDGMYSKDQVKFSDEVQLAALQTCGDLRSLLPKIWSQARSPLLRAAALTEDQILIGGSIRYFRSKTNILRDIEDQDEEDLTTVNKLLLPFGRSLVANWSMSNRREAGYVFTHFVGSGQGAQQLLQELSKMCKRMDPVRLMETHMASLRTSFDQWLLNEPEEVTSEHPTDEEMAAFEQAEEAHQDEFDLLLQQSKSLAQTLKPSKKKALEAKLQDPMLAFLKEGIRFAFSLDTTTDDDDLLPGARLTFLSVLEHFGKLCRSSANVLLRDYWTEQVLALQQDVDYDQAHQDDLEAMEQFAKLMGFPMVSAENVVGQKSPKSVLVRDYDNEDDDDEEGSSTVTPRRSSSGLSEGRRSSVARSSVSTALSPLLEESDNEETPAKNRRSSVSMDTLEEEEEEENSARSSNSVDE